MYIYLKLIFIVILFLGQNLIFGLYLSNDKKYALDSFINLVCKFVINFISEF